jgi:regulator of sigma E protease
VLGVVIGVGLLIFIHELGHFLAAKWAGVKVEVFSLGFGKRLVGFERGGTDYRISMLPWAATCACSARPTTTRGQAPTTDEGDFRNKSPGKRFVILVGGVVMNLLLAAVGFVLAFGLGIEFTAPEVGAIDPGSPAAKADLRPGDQVLAIDDDEVLGFQDLQTLVALASGDITPHGPARRRHDHDDRAPRARPGRVLRPARRPAAPRRGRGESEGSPLAATSS